MCESPPRPPRLSCGRRGRFRLHRKIFDYKLPSAPVERGTAAKAWCLAVKDIGDLHSDNFVRGPAIWAIERDGLSFDHADFFAPSQEMPRLSYSV